MMNLISNFTISLTRNTNKFFLISILLLMSVPLKSQFDFSVELYKNHYSEYGIFANRRFGENHPEPRTYSQVYQTNLAAHRGTLSFTRKGLLIFSGIERNSITYNLQRFDGNGQLIRYFSFSTLCVGAGKSWILSKPTANKVVLGINAYGSKILNKNGVEKNSMLFFSPSTNTYQSVRDKERESFSIRNGRNLSLGMNSYIGWNPALKNSRIMFIFKFDFSISRYFDFNWSWEEDNSILPWSIGGGDVFRRAFSLGLSYRLEKEIH